MKRRTNRRAIMPDVKYNSALVTRFVNYVMRDGKKSLARRLVYNAFDQMAKDLKADDPLEVFMEAMENVKPQLEVKSRRVGGATYQVPVEVPADRQVALAMRWIIRYARGRKGVPMDKALAAELQDAYNNTGNAVKRRDETHKMAAANRAFAHYR